MDTDQWDDARVLDELAFLATVEHALVVEYLTVCCALGHDLPAEDGGATGPEGAATAAAAATLAQGEMVRLAGVVRGLVAAGRQVELGRADGVAGDAGPELALGPAAAVTDGWLDRLEAVAAAVDRRYERLRPAVTSAPVFGPGLGDELRTVVDAGLGHAAEVAPLRAALGAAAPADVVRVTRRDPADAFERRLLEAADRAYGMVIAALRERFAEPDRFVGAAFRGFAVYAMASLDNLDRLLVQRGLLPAFTVP